jgi:hypothetical protein
MPEADLIELFVHPLERLGIRYLVTGSVAATLYGEPRATHGIDLIGPRSCGRGATGGSPDLGLKADVWLAGRVPLHEWAFRHAREYTIGGLRVRLAPPEYVIVRKLEFYREGGGEKHLRDIRSILAVSGDQLDRATLADWIRRRGLDAQWSAVGEP